MDVTGGGLSWTFELDYSQIGSARSALVKYFNDIGLNAEEAGKRADEAMETIAKTVSDAMEQVGSGAEAVGVLKAALEEMNEQLANMDDGEAKQVLQGVVNGFESVISEMEEAIEKNGELGDSFNSVSDILVKLLGGQENYNKIISNLPEPLKAAISGIQGMTTAAKAFIATPLGAVIAAIVLALQAMRTWLNSSVEGQLKLAEITGYLKGALGQLKEIVSTVGKWLYKAFSDPKQAIKDLVNTIKENLANRLKAIGDIGAAVGKILKSAFSLDLDGVKEGVKELGESFLQFATGVDDLPSKIKSKVGEITDAAKEQAAINRERKELEIAESQFRIRRAELERQMNEARAKLWDNKATQAEQKKALEDYRKYNDELLKAEEGFIDKKIALQEREMALTTNGIEDENTLRDLQAQKIEKQAEAAQRMLQINRMGNRIDSSAETQLKAEKKIAYELTKLRQSNQEKNVALMLDGYAKQVAAAKLAYQAEIIEIEHTEEAWKKLQHGKLTAEQSAETDKARRIAAEAMQKANADALKNMLEDYKTYEQKVADMERDYANVIGYIRAEAYKVDEQGNFIHNEAEILAYETAIANAIKEQAKERLGLRLDEINDTAYSTVEERMEAINEAYETYIENIRVAGASEAEIANVEQERVETAGKLAQINAKIDNIEAQKLVAVEKGDTDEVKSLNAELARLQKQLKDIDKALGKKDLGTVFREWADALEASDLISAGGELGSVIAQIGEAAGNEDTANFGSTLELAGNVGAKIASGDYLGAALTVITEIGTAIAEDTAKTQEFQREMQQAAVDADLLRIAMMLNTGDTIFGTDVLENINGAVEAMNVLDSELNKIRIENLMTPIYGSASVLGQSYQANIDAIVSHFGKGRLFKTKDYSGWSNFWGKPDEFDTLEEFAERNGLDLLDKYEHLNKEVLELFKNTYSDLDEADKQWIDNAIAYSKQYEEAMEQVANYLTDLFGNVAETIADQFINSFAMDFDAVVADVARNMVKNLIKSMILEKVMDGYKDDFMNIMTSGEFDDDEARTAAMLALFTQMGGEIEALQPDIQNLLEAYQNYIGDLEGETAAMSGNLLQSTSQDSVSLLNGQLNTIRTNQALVTGRMDSILLQLSGIHDEVRDFHGDSNAKLNQLIDNTSERGSIARAFGLA